MTKEQFVERFLKNFMDNIPKRQQKKYRIGTKKKDFLWNIFAAKLIPCYEGDKAREQYDKADKTFAEEILYDNGFLGYDSNNSVMLSKQHMTAEGIDKSGKAEFYVIGQDFSWCYVITHEFDLCGPFFCYKPRLQSTDN